LPLSIRSIFYPDSVSRVVGWPGHIQCDILAVFATLFGSGDHRWVIGAEPGRKAV